MGMYLSLRGIGYKYGQNTPLPPTKKMSKIEFIGRTWLEMMVCFLMVDAVETFWENMVPSNNNNISIFDQSRPWWERYLLSTAIHVGMCAVLYGAINFSYLLLSLIGVVILGHSPSNCPPAFLNILQAGSLREGWGTYWQQFIRRTFLVSGGYPCGWLAEFLGFKRKYGYIFGSFLASGLFHELPLRGMLDDYRFDWRITAFFVLNAMCIGMEEIWTKMTKMRVKGWPGRIWCAVILFGAGQYMFCTY